MKAKQLLNMLEWVEHFKKQTPEQILGQISDEQFKLIFWAAADLFKQMKNEAVRRGIWEELTKKRD